MVSHPQRRRSPSALLGTQQSSLVAPAVFSRSLLVIQLLETPFVLRLTVLYDKQIAEDSSLLECYAVPTTVHSN